MDRMVVYTVSVGVLMYILVIYLAMIQKDLTGQQLLLILTTPLVMGVISRKAKKGLILGFAMCLVMLIMEAIILQPGAFADPNVAMAIVIMSLPFAGISAALGAIGGLIGKRIFKSLK